MMTYFLAVCPVTIMYIILAILLVHVKQWDSLFNIMIDQTGPISKTEFDRLVLSSTNFTETRRLKTASHQLQKGKASIVQN